VCDEWSDRRRDIRETSPTKGRTLREPQNDDAWLKDSHGDDDTRSLQTTHDRSVRVRRECCRRARCRTVPRVEVNPQNESGDRSTVEMLNDRVTNERTKFALSHTRDDTSREQTDDAWLEDPRTDGTRSLQTSQDRIEDVLRESSRVNTTVPRVEVL
jgi:hypothetical protein